MTLAFLVRWMSIIYTNIYDLDNYILKAKEMLSHWVETSLYADLLYERLGVLTEMRSYWNEEYVMTVIEIENLYHPPIGGQ
jgi:hypothetical protein